jgi:hypothetical protein
MKPLRNPSLLLRAEGLAELAACCVLYHRIFPGHAGLFALLFLAPDLALAGYLLRDKARAAALYNLAHSSVLPLALAICAWAWPSPLGGQVALIWLAHIAFDRMAGYGLKFPDQFRHTHIQNASDYLSPLKAL